jgi:hypothetical protein
MATSVTPPWPERAAAAVRELGGRPWTLFAVLLALNALALPYAGLVHDARLYGVQVLNKVEDGAFADDLFFRYGSQDRFSVFSTAAAPLVAAVGLDAAFLTLYLVSNALLILATQRLVRTLIKDRLVSTLALVVLAVAPIGFGGLSIFHVNENFLTPRLLANALTLFGLERALRGRFLTALAVVAAGGLFHPLMAVGGLAAVAGLWAWERLPRPVVIGLAAAFAAAAVAVLAVPPLGFAVFGRMDAEWLSRVRIASAYNFPLEWEWTDWLQAGASLAAVAVVAWKLRRKNPRAARLLAVLGLVAGGGFAATLVAGEVGYRLLFQGQPYRALWLPQLLQAPLLFWLAARSWRRGDERGRAAAVGLAGVVLTRLDVIPLLLPLTAFVFLVIANRGLRVKPERPDWLSRSLGGGLVVGLTCWTVLRLAVFLFWDRLRGTIDGLDGVRGLLDTPGPLGWALAVAAALTWLRGRAGFGVRFAAAAGAVALAVPLALFGWTNTDYYQDHYQRYHQDVRFVADFLAGRREAGRTPSVYWSTGRTDAIWLRLRSKSYFTSLQVQGVLFSRDTALEGQRRALVVRRFEMEQLARDRCVLSGKWVEQMQQLFQTPLPDDPDAAPEPPTQADLEALCREPAVDYVVVPHAFDLPCAAQNGRFYIYDCQKVRDALAAREAPPGADAGPALASSTLPSSPRTPLP